MGAAPLRIGLSACFFHPDPQRNIFKGKTLAYCEQSMAHHVMSAGLLPIVLPMGTDALPLEAMVEQIDGLLLTGGSDLAPESYGETALRPEWAGDAVRDEYEIALLRACLARDKPVYGICRGAQVMNVALGGTLYQDITLQQPGTLVHRDWNMYDANRHDVEFAPESRLARVYGCTRARINSVHHQGIKDVAEGLAVEAWAPEDDVIEALRYTAEPEKYCVGVQWHPEFIDGRFPELLDPRPLLDDFLTEVRRRARASVAP